MLGKGGENGDSLRVRKNIRHRRTVKGHAGQEGTGLHRQGHSIEGFKKLRAKPRRVSKATRRKERKRDRWGPTEVTSGHHLLTPHQKLKEDTEDLGDGPRSSCGKG